MNDARGRYETKFRDPKTQGQILLKLLLEERALSSRELAGLLDKDVSVVVGNLAELRSKGWIGRTVEEGSSRVELTVAGIDAVRKMSAE